MTYAYSAYGDAGSPAKTSPWFVIGGLVLAGAGAWYLWNWNYDSGKDEPLRWNKPRHRANRRVRRNTRDAYRYQGKTEKHRLLNRISQAQRDYLHGQGSDTSVTRLIVRAERAGASHKAVAAALARA